MPQHIIADPGNGVIYGSVWGDAPQFGNEIVIIDPNAGLVLDSFFVGSNPNALATSEDGSTLWVGIDGALSVREVDLTTSPPTPGSTYPVPPKGGFGPATILDMVVMPGAPQTIVVSLDAVGSSAAGMAVVLDSGVPRPLTSPSNLNLARLAAISPDVIYAYNNLNTGYHSYSVGVSAVGLSVLEQDLGLSGFATDIVYADGRIYAGSGQVVDVSEPHAPVQAGTFAFQGAVLPEPAEERVIMVTPEGFNTPTIIRSLNSTTFTQAAYAELPTVAADRVVDLTTTDGQVFAFIAQNTLEDPELHIVDNPFGP